MKELETMKGKLKKLIEEKKKYQKSIEQVDHEIMEMITKIIEYVAPKNNTEEHIDEEEKPQAFVRVQFKPNGRTYDYLWNQDYAPGEYVIVDNMYKDEERVKVVKCYRRKTMPEGVILKEAKPIE